MRGSWRIRGTYLPARTATFAPRLAVSHEAHLAIMGTRHVNLRSMTIYISRLLSQDRPGYRGTLAWTSSPFHARWFSAMLNGDIGLDVDFPSDIFSSLAHRHPIFEANIRPAGRCSPMQAS